VPGAERADKPPEESRDLPPAQLRGHAHQPGELWEKGSFVFVR